MYPSTAQSTIGGFLSGGSGGTGSIAHGSNWQGFVTALDIALPGSDELQHVEGDAAQPFVHTYGTAASSRGRRCGSSRCRTGEPSTRPPHLRGGAHRGPDPARARPGAASGERGPRGGGVHPAKDPAIVAERASLRGIVDAVVLDEARSLIEAAGGTVEEVREGLQQTTKVSMLSYNHPIWWLKRNTPDTEYFHVEVGGEALIDRIAEVEAVYPGGMLHIEAAHVGPIGMLTAPLHRGRGRLRRLPRPDRPGVRVHSPHQYYVDHGVEELLALKASTDPEGLLNPGTSSTRRSCSPAARRPRRSRPSRGSASERHGRCCRCCGAAGAAGGRRCAAFAQARGTVRARGRRRFTADTIVVQRPAPSSTTVRTCHCSPTSCSPTTSAVQPSSVPPPRGSTSGSCRPWRSRSPTSTAGPPGTVWLDASTMFETVVQIGRAVALTGAGTLVFANGHGGNVACSRSRSARSGSGTA